MPSDAAPADTWVWVCALAGLKAELAAAAAAAIAARHERACADGSGPLDQHHSSMAATHRRIEQLHRAAARIHRNQAERFARPRANCLVVPELLVAVARTLDAGGAALTLLGAARYEESAVASDETTTVAQELEFVLGEGPVHDAARSGRLVAEDRTTMPERWTRYSPAVAELGMHSVTAAPMSLHGTCFGVLTAFNAGTAGTEVVGMASFLSDTVLVATSADESLLAVDDRAVVHQATGMIAARLRCPVADALAVLRARAFAENQAIGALARRVVDREICFE